MNPVFWGVLAYVAVQLAVGLYVSRRVTSASDYFVAGRRLGPLLGTATIFATWFGAEACLGTSGAVYANGLAGGQADPFAYGLCLLVMALFFAARFRRAETTTLADHFRIRYSAGVEKLAALLIVPGSLLWAAAQIRAFGQVLSATSGLELELTMGVATLVVVAYTASGGLYSDAVTDLVQGAAVILGLGILVAVLALGPADLFGAIARTEPARLVPFGGSSPLLTLEVIAIPILGSITSQELFARTVAVRTPELARRSGLAAAGVYMAVGLVPVVLGLAGPALVPGLSEPEQLLPTLAATYLPVVLYVAFSGAIVSAILSTVDSCLLSASALTANNLVFSRVPGWSEPRKLLLSRALVVAFGLVAWGLATRAEGIYQLVETSSAFGGSGLFVILVLGTFTLFGGPVAAFAAMATGTLGWVALKWSGAPAPFLSSLVFAAVAYALGAAVDGRAIRRPKPASVAERGAES